MVSMRRLFAELASSYWAYFSDFGLEVTFFTIFALVFWIRLIMVEWANSSSLRLAYFLPNYTTLSEILNEVIGREPDIVLVTLAGLELGKQR